MAGIIAAGHNAVMQPFRSLADIRTLEALPYATQIPARSPVGLIGRAAALFPQRDALVFLPSGELEEAPTRVPYAQQLEQIQRARRFRSQPLRTKYSASLSRRSGMLGSS